MRLPYDKGSQQRMTLHAFADGQSPPGSRR